MLWMLPVMPNASWGAIFDWDGVLINSAKHHKESWERLAKEEKRPLPPNHFERGFGMKNEKIIPDVLGWQVSSSEMDRLSLRKEELYRESLKQLGIQPLPGVIEWLKILAEAHVPCVIGSSTHLANINLGLELTGLRPHFSKIVSAEDVHHGKPHPEVFLIAAQKIARDPKKCVVFEDAHVGIAAARAGGMKVVAVATTHPASELKSADQVVARLDELSVSKLEQWF
jgi:HAD superfamily hydrolase (TIGR01509 family)